MSELEGRYGEEGFMGEGLRWKRRWIAAGVLEGLEGKLGMSGGYG